MGRGDCARVGLGTLGRLLATIAVSSEQTDGTIISGTLENGDVEMTSLVSLAVQWLGLLGGASAGMAASMGETDGTIVSSTLKNGGDETMAPAKMVGAIVSSTLESGSNKMMAPVNVAIPSSPSSTVHSPVQSSHNPSLPTLHALGPMYIAVTVVVVTVVILPVSALLFVEVMKQGGRVIVWEKDSEMVVTFKMHADYVWIIRGLFESFNYNGQMN
ncbi:hypothetical protein ARMGADRAFT_1034656 [Armillaria gallica]|uniref:Uncharacterized protein n=1 Tax=Armillaria gallica TaxID=47427 RepID=A0A2H3D8K1_ARMGA|nr:hypothetical protein ARMGADRAFT_1034656 [Armillaria gallica]